ncbi:MAG: hypothetical protein GEU99_16235 [Luteitalea sp.]|nr:hypothetical protein [Luteitalea sp.]
MRVTTEKLPGVDSATVSLNEGRAVVELQPGNAITMAEIRQSAERNGFTPRDAVVHAQADVIAEGDKLQLQISGTNDRYEIATTPHVEDIQQELRKHAGQAVMVEGMIPAPKDLNATPMMQVNSVKPIPHQ